MHTVYTGVDLYDHALADMQLGNIHIVRATHKYVGAKIEDPG